MAHFVTKVKVDENPQVNFNHSPEIAHWAKKLNMSAAAFQKIFTENNNSISKTLAACKVQP